MHLVYEMLWVASQTVGVDAKLGLEGVYGFDVQPFAFNNQR